MNLMIWLAQKTRLAKSAPEADMNESFVENKEKKKRNHVSCVENKSQIAGHPKSSSKRFGVGQRGKVRACFLSLCLSLFPKRIKCLTFLRFSFLFCLPLSLTEILLVYVFSCFLSLFTSLLFFFLLREWVKSIQGSRYSISIHRR